MDVADIADLVVCIIGFAIGLWFLMMFVYIYALLAIRSREYNDQPTVKWEKALDIICGVFFCYSVLLVGSLIICSAYLIFVCVPYLQGTA